MYSAIFTTAQNGHAAKTARAQNGLPTKDEFAHCERAQVLSKFVILKFARGSADRANDAAEVARSLSRLEVGIVYQISGAALLDDTAVLDQPRQPTLHAGARHAGRLCNLVGGNGAALVPVIVGEDHHDHHQ